MVAFFPKAGSFGSDYGGVGFVYFREEGGVAVEVLGDEDSGAGEEDMVPFVLEGGALIGCEGRECGEVVDGDIGDYGCCEWICGG